MLSHMAATAAQRIRGFAWCCAAVFGPLLVPPPAALAQDAPRLVCVAAADADTGPVAALGDFPGGMLIGAEKGLFLARAADGKVTVTPVRGDRDAERVLSIHSLPGGGALIGAWNGVFVAREAGGTISVAAVVDPDTGPVFAMRDLAGGVLIGSCGGIVPGAAGERQAHRRAGRRHRARGPHVRFPGRRRADLGRARDCSSRVQRAARSRSRPSRWSRPSPPTASRPCAPCAASQAAVC